MKNKNLVSVILSVVLSLVFVAVVAYASTTISTNVSTGGTLSVGGTSTLTGAVTASGALTVTGASTLTGAVSAGSTLSVTGLATLLGGATTTTLTLLNGEVISNASDGVIQLGGIASTTSLTLLNGETITNATDGTIALTGAFTVSGLSTFTGLGTFLGGATTTTLTLLNGEIVSNATDGVIQLGGIASTTSLTLLNGETITNATDGIIAISAATTTLANGETIDNGTDGIVKVLGGILQSGDSAGVDAAAGRTMVYGYYMGKTTAVTGTPVGVRGNARVLVASSGTLEGGQFLAGNGSNSTLTTTDGVAVTGTVRGARIGVASTGDVAGTGPTIANAQGAYVIMDLDHTADVTTAHGIYIKYNAGGTSGSGTITTGYGIQIDNEAVGTTGQQLTAALYISGTNQSGGVKSWNYGIDMSGVTGTLGFGTADIRLGYGDTIKNPAASTTAISGALTVGPINYAADAESSDAYVITLSPVPTSYVAGMMIVFTVNTANTDGATINVNGLGAKALVKGNNAALATNDMIVNRTYIAVYDGTQFDLINPTTQ